MLLFSFDEKFPLFDVTPVENIFLQEYMPGAKGEYVKVYLYGLMQSYHPIEGMALSNMEKDLSMSIDEIEMAFRYWERKGLVLRISDAPVKYKYMNAKQIMFMKNELPQDREYLDFAEAVYGAFGNARQIHGTELALAYEWVEDMDLPIEVVLYLLQYSIVNRGINFSFKSIEKTAVILAENNVRNIEEAENILNRSKVIEEGTRKILRRLGKRRQPSEDEMDLYAKWVNEWGFAHEAIEAACVETTKGDPNMGYLEGILRGLLEEKGGGFTTKKEIEKHLKEQKKQSKPVKELMNILGIRYIRSNKLMDALYGKMLVLAPHEVILIAAREVAKSGGKMDELNLLLKNWSKKDIITPEKAKQHVDEFYQANQTLSIIYDAAGHTGKPTAAHRKQLKKWQEKWSFEKDMLVIAAEGAQGATQKIPYIDAILSSWYERGIKTKEEALEDKEKYKKDKALNTSIKKSKKVSEQQYEQRNYEKIDLLEQAISFIEEENTDDR